MLDRMVQARFDIVVFGLQPGKDPQDVKQCLARGFGVAEARVVPLLSGPVVVKRGIDRATASLFLNVLHQSGVRAEERPTAVALAAVGNPGGPPWHGLSVSNPPARPPGEIPDLLGPPPGRAPRSPCAVDDASETFAPLLPPDAVHENTAAPKIAWMDLFDEPPRPMSEGPTVERLRALIESVTLGVERGAARVVPRSAMCRTVLEVAPLCPASQVGVRPGDLVVSVDMAPAATYDTDAAFEPGPRAWEVYLRESNEIVRVKTNGAPMGMRLGPTPAAAAAGYKMSAEDLLSLWELAAYPAVLSRARSAVGPTVSRTPGNGAGHRDCPEYALLGAVLIETGRSEQGFEILHDYLENYSDGWPRTYAGLAMHYYARANLDSNRAKAHEMAIDAYAMYPCGPNADLLERLTGESPPLRSQRWVGRRFPLDYDFMIERATGQAGLGGVIETMGDHQLLTVCSMGSYRANGPYSLFMNRYARYASTLKDTFNVLHVTTASRLASHDDWYAGEHRARGLGVKFEILYDEHNAIATGLGAEACPFVVVVDNQGIVRGEDISTEVGLWHALFNFSVAPAMGR